MDLLQESDSEQELPPPVQMGNEMSERKLAILREFNNDVSDVTATIPEEHKAPQIREVQMTLSLNSSRYGQSLQSQ